MTTGNTTGVLAIWNDCAPGHQDAYEAWYMREHLPERLSLPGFRRGRRYQAADDGPGFFTYYETDTPDVMATADYLARVQDPTPLTRQMMSSVFTNMNRTVCRVAGRVGHARGAHAAVVRLNAAPSDAHLKATLAEIQGKRGIARAEAWVGVETDVSADTAESRLRGGDATAAACLFVETLRPNDAQRALADLKSRHTGLAGLYRLLCELTPGGPEPGLPDP